MTATTLAPRAAAVPIPPGRGRWRLTAHRRVYAAGALPRDTMIAELPDTRSRRLTQAWDKPAQLIFTLDGHSSSAALVRELTTDVIAWRWDENAGQDVAMFRGIVGQAQDTISEQSATVAFTCHDYLAMLDRRFWTNPNAWVWAATDQDTIAAAVINAASTVTSGTGATAFNPGAFLPITPVMVDPAGNPRATLSGQLRDRNYPGQTSFGEMLNKLATPANGFDYDVQAGGPTNSLDRVRIFYPYQGVLRTTPQLVYGVTVSALTRAFNSADYANYQRVNGNNGTAVNNATQVFSETWNSDTNNVTVAPQGLWMADDNASDVSVQSTLDQRAAGNLARSAVVVPSYTLTLRPGFYVYGAPNMGDVIPLIIQEGRLNVNTTVRVVGIDYAISDDGAEDVVLTVGRPDITITDILTASANDVDALARR